eukprot:4853128-Lingulodinium_polyedra.AAC.1
MQTIAIAKHQDACFWPHVRGTFRLHTHTGWDGPNAPAVPTVINCLINQRARHANCDQPTTTGFLE